MKTWNILSFFHASSIDIMSFVLEKFPNKTSPTNRVAMGESHLCVAVISVWCTSHQSKFVGKEQHQLFESNSIIAFDHGYICMYRSLYTSICHIYIYISFYKSRCLIQAEKVPQWLLHKEASLPVHSIWEQKTPVERLFPVAWSEQNICRMGFILVVAEDKTISQHFKKIHLVKAQEKKTRDFAWAND